MTDIKKYQIGGEDSPDPVIGYGLVDANTLIEGGRLVWARVDTGYVQNSTYAAANPSNVRCLGVATQHVDNTTTNTDGNPGTASNVNVSFVQGVFYVQSDGTLTQATLGQSIYLVSDVTGTNNGLITCGIAPTTIAGVVRPFVGHVAPNPVPSTQNPYAGLIPVRVAPNPGLGSISAVCVKRYANDSLVHTGAFTCAPGYMHKINPSGATFAFTLPAITRAIDGMAIAVVNVSTGSTATVAAPTGSDNIGNSAGSSTGATAAGPTGGATKVYTADYTQLAWLVGI